MDGYNSMTSLTTARNQTQRTITIPLNERKVNETPAEFYTCPANKKAKIIGSCICTGLGASTEVRLNADGVPAARYIAADVTANTSKPFDISLDAGETLSKSQNSGTNGELDVTAIIEETQLN